MVLTHHISQQVLHLTLEHILNFFQTIAWSADLGESLLAYLRQRQRWAMPRGARVKTSHTLQRLCWSLLSMSSRCGSSWSQFPSWGNARWGWQERVELRVSSQHGRDFKERGQCEMWAYGGELTPWEKRQQVSTRELMMKTELPQAEPRLCHGGPGGRYPLTLCLFVNRLKIFPQRCEILTNAHRVGVFSRHPAWREKHRWISFTRNPRYPHHSLKSARWAHAQEAQTAPVCLQASPHFSSVYSPHFRDVWTFNLGVPVATPPPGSFLLSS